MCTYLLRVVQLQKLGTTSSKSKEQDRIVRNKTKLEATNGEITALNGDLEVLLHHLDENIAAQLSTVFREVCSVSVSLFVSVSVSVSVCRSTCALRSIARCTPVLSPLLLPSVLLMVIVRGPVCALCQLLDLQGKFYGELSGTMGRVNALVEQSAFRSRPPLVVPTSTPAAPAASLPTSAAAPAPAPAPSATDSWPIVSCRGLACERFRLW